MKIFSSIKTKVFLLLIITIFAHFTLNNKLKKSKNTGFFEWAADKIRKATLDKMKIFFEGRYNILDNSKPEQIKCWNYVWTVGIKGSPGLWAILKTILGSAVSIFMGDYPRVVLDQDLMKLFKSVDETVTIENRKLKCKQILSRIVEPIDEPTPKPDLPHKPDPTPTKPDPNLVPAKLGFVTSSAGINRDASFRNPDLFKILNAN